MYQNYPLALIVQEFWHCYSSTLDLKTNIHDEGVCGAETIGNTLLLVACFLECRMIMFNWQVHNLKLWSVDLDPKALFACLHGGTRPNHIRRNSVWGGGGGVNMVLLVFVLQTFLSRMSVFNSAKCESYMYSKHIKHNT